ncbi:MAG TPA: hypothetical protein VF077_03830 [Nitrospiraceae bacterium]
MPCRAQISGRSIARLTRRAGGGVGSSTSGTAAPDLACGLSRDTGVSSGGGLAAALAMAGGIALTSVQRALNVRVSMGTRRIPSDSTLTGNAAGAVADRDGGDIQDRANTTAGSDARATEYGFRFTRSLVEARTDRTVLGFQQLAQSHSSFRVTRQRVHDMLSQQRKRLAVFLQICP